MAVRVCHGRLCGIRVGHVALGCRQPHHLSVHHHSSLLHITPPRRVSFGQASTTPRCREAKITDTLVLANPTRYEQAFKIWAADAYNTTLGGALALRLDGYPMTQVGTWITLPTAGADYGVSPGQEVILNFALTVPPNAIPGDHVGGIEALDITPPPGNSSGNKVLVHEGIGVPIFINVPGPRHPSAAITFVKEVTSVPLLSFANGSSQARVGYQIENTGNTILRGKARVWVTNLFGQTVKTFPENVVGNLLPAEAANFPEPLWKSLPIAGPQTVHVAFSPSWCQTRDGVEPRSGSCRGC